MGTRRTLKKLTQRPSSTDYRPASANVPVLELWPEQVKAMQAWGEMLAAAIEGREPSAGNVVLLDHYLRAADYDAELVNAPALA